jgi:hypothetical protein
VSIKLFKFSLPTEKPQNSKFALMYFDELEFWARDTCHTKILRLLTYYILFACLNTSKEKGIRMGKWFLNDSAFCLYAWAVYNDVALFLVHQVKGCPLSCPHFSGISSIYLRSNVFRTRFWDLGDKDCSRNIWYNHRYPRWTWYWQI